MTKNQMFGYSLGHAAGAMLYISAIAWLLSNAKNLFGEAEAVIWVPIAMLSLLTFSVAVMGVLIFGRPVMLYLNSQKKEAMNFLFHTLGWLLVGVFLVFIYLYVR